MKRVAVFMIIIAAITICCMFAASNNLQAMASAKVELKNKDFRAVEECFVYKEKNAASAEVYLIEKNQKVEVLDTQTLDTVTWYKVSTPNGDGYIEAIRLYVYRPPVSYSFNSARATVQDQDKNIYLYNQPDGSAVLTVYDGAAITVLSSEGEYSSILYQGEKYYIKSTNISQGLTYYQRTALIIGCIALISVILIGSLAYINKNRVSGRAKK